MRKATTALLVVLGLLLTVPLLSFGLTALLSQESTAHAAPKLGPGTELNFKGATAGTVKTITMENVGTATAWLKTAWIEEGGVKTKADFEIVAAAGPNPCNLPGGAAPFQKLNVKDSCEVDIKFVSGAEGKAAKYVVEEEGCICNNTVSFPLNS